MLETRSSGSEGADQSHGGEWKQQLLDQGQGGGKVCVLSMEEEAEVIDWEPEWPLHWERVEDEEQAIRCPQMVPCLKGLLMLEVTRKMRMEKGKPYPKSSPTPDLCQGGVGR
eukprot:7781176-Karenia_brevis.AAC.1